MSFRISKYLDSPLEGRTILASVSPVNRAMPNADSENDLPVLLDERSAIASNFHAIAA
jgi:hypothetical protein